LSRLESVLGMSHVSPKEVAAYVEKIPDHQN
jgi:hypothetical protein